MVGSANADLRASTLDRALTSLGTIGGSVADDLLGVADVLADNVALRRVLTDSSAPLPEREALVDRLLQGRIDPAALHIVHEAVKLDWPAGGPLRTAVARQGIRAAFVAADQAGRLDRVTDELFQVGQIVNANRPLRAALADFTAPKGARQDILSRLLGSQAAPETVLLARRAVVSPRRSYQAAIEHYLDLAAGLKKRRVASVRVAKPLTAEQEARLAAALTQQAGRPVSMQIEVDPSVVGGVRVAIGDDVIDGTVAGRLEAARRQLV